MAKKIHVRPSGAQSKIGFMVGIIFCLIGVFFVIPTIGPFGIVWTAVAVFITYSHWRNGFTDRKIDTHVIEIDDTDADNVTVTSRRGSVSSYSVSDTEYRKTEYGSGKDIENRLKSLQSLYDQRLITKEEYEEKKKEILKEL